MGQWDKLESKQYVKTMMKETGATILTRIVHDAFEETGIQRINNMALSRLK